MRNLKKSKNLTAFDLFRINSIAEIIPKIFIKMGEFWTIIAKNKQKFENDIEKMRKKCEHV